MLGKVSALGGPKVTYYFKSSLAGAQRHAGLQWELAQEGQILGGFNLRGSRENVEPCLGAWPNMTCGGMRTVHLGRAGGGAES